MKVLQTLTVFLAIIFLALPVSAFAQEIVEQEGKAKAIFTVNKTTAVANGEDKIKIIFGHFWIGESSQPSGQETSAGASPSNPRPYCISGGTKLLHGIVNGVYITIQGENNVVSNDYGTLAAIDRSDLQKDYMIDNGIAGSQGAFNCQTGYSIAYISSTKAESKTIRLSYSGASGGYGDSAPENPFDPITVIFTAPTSSPSTPTPAPRRVAPTPVPPVKPIVSLTNSYNIPSALNNSVPKPFTSTETPIIHKGEKLSFSGTTSPNAKLTLTIKPAHSASSSNTSSNQFFVQSARAQDDTNQSVAGGSDPITKEVTADADGKWEYNLDPNELQLDYGDHTITAYATDTNGVTGDEVELVKFTLEKLPPVEVVKETYQFKYTDLFTPLNYILSAITLILIGGLVYLVVVRRRKLPASKNQTFNMPA